jgi:menaquinone-dependent protoporphyrinogen oxidase
MSMTVLIVFQSTDGHTATVAHHIAKGISDRGINVTVERADDAPPPAGFDGVVLGDSIHIGRHSRELLEYAKVYRSQLTAVPLAMFQVSLTSATGDDESIAEATAMLEEFCDNAGLEPDHVGLFAGALFYTRHRGLERWLMRRLAADAGLDEDTATDHVYTDWAAVDSFAATAARLVRRHAAHGRAVKGVTSLVDFEVPIVEPTATLDQVVEALAAHGNGLVIVCSTDLDPLCTASAGGVVGVVSERDLVDALHEGADFSEVWAADVMSTGLVSMPSSATAEEMAEVMIDKHIRHVVVPRTDGRAGVVSMRSLLGQLTARRIGAS